jgi:hypothetical protein
MNSNPSLTESSFDEMPAKTEAEFIAQAEQVRDALEQFNSIQGYKNNLNLVHAGLQHLVDTTVRRLNFSWLPTLVRHLLASFPWISQVY